MRHQDPDGIIGGKPKRSLEQQVKGLGLFEEAMVEAIMGPLEGEGRRDVEPVGILPSKRLPEPKRRRAVKLPLSERDRDRLAAIERLKELTQTPLLELALSRLDRFEAPGVTADDLFLIVMRFPQAALLGSEQRSLSWGGPWLATLERQGLLWAFKISGQPVLRRSLRKEARRNRQQVYLHPTDHRAR